MEPRTIARVIALGRLAYGAGLLVAPRPLTRGWVGRDAGRAGTKVLAAGLGARDVGLGLGVLSSVAAGGARPWLVASAGADLADLLATIRMRRDIPTVGVLGVAVIAGASAAVDGWLATQDDW